ncbi:MAG: hypothetical protein AB1700_19595, partial [Bacillota bacterium]
MHLTALFLAFAVLLVAALREARLWKSLAAAAVVLTLVSDTSGMDAFLSVRGALLDPSTVNLVLGVAIIAALGSVMKVFGWVDLLMRSLTGLLLGKWFPQDQAA